MSPGRFTLTHDLGPELHVEGRNHQQDMSHPVPANFKCEGMVRGVSIIFLMVSLEAEKTLILIESNSPRFSCMDHGLGSSARSRTWTRAANTSSSVFL